MDNIEKTQEQVDCIEFEGKPLIIQAGPGAGKTFVIVERIKYLLNEKNVDHNCSFSRYINKYDYI